MFKNEDKGVTTLEGESSIMRMAFNKKRRGAVAFEYVIIMVIMVTMLFAAFAILTPVVMTKVNEIKGCITNSSFTGSTTSTTC